MFFLLNPSLNQYRKAIFRNTKRYYNRNTKLQIRQIQIYKLEKYKDTHNRDTEIQKLRNTEGLKYQKQKCSNTKYRVTEIKVKNTNYCNTEIKIAEVEKFKYRITEIQVKQKFTHNSKVTHNSFIKYE